MNIRAVLFDLDGTLADTAPDLGAALNSLLRALGQPEKALADIRPHSSHGAAALLAFGMGITPEHPDYPGLRRRYLDEYQACNGEASVLFDGIPKLLEEIDGRNLVWGIVTNKPEALARELADALPLPVLPAVLVGGDTCAQAKPSPQPLHHACAAIGIPAAHCLYIGDAERDMQAAKNAGMVAVLAEWGYIGADDCIADWPADYTVRHPADIVRLL